MGYIYVFVFWIGMTLVLGALGSKKNIGFGFAFLWSFLLSPIIGLAIVLLSKQKKDLEKVKESILNQLDKIDSLKEKNILTESQFENEKRNLIYRLNNIGDENESDKTPHYVALCILIILIVVGAFWVKNYYDSKNNSNQQYLNQSNTESTSFEKQNEVTENGLISGYASYASEGIPDFIDVYAENKENHEIIKHNIFNRETGVFQIEVPNGIYYVYSTNDIENIKSDKNVIIEIINGNKVKEVKAQDLSVSNFVPVKEENDEY